MAGGISILLLLIILVVGAAIVLFLFATSAGVQMRAERRDRGRQARPVHTRVEDDGADRGKPEHPAP